MRVLWVNQFAALPTDGGGTRHFELGRELVRRGWQVTVLASDFHLHRRAYTRRASQDDRGTVGEVVDGVEFRWLWAAAYGGNNWRRALNWGTFARSIRRECNVRPRPDLVIGSSPQLFAARSAAEAARRWACPFVFEVRDLWPESLVAAGGRKGLAYHVLDRVALDLYRRADRVMVLSDGAGAYLKERVGLRDVVCIPNGADVQDAAVSIPAAVPDRPLRLVYAGAHGPANGLDRLLDAAAAFVADGSVEFVLVGDGPSKSALMTQADTRRLTNVEFRPTVPKSELRALFAGADAGLMLLRDAPLFSFAVSPNKLFDYLAAGLVVINNVPGEVAGMVAASGAGVQARGSSGADLIDAVSRLRAVDQDTRGQMRACGRRWLEANHSREVLGRRLFEALEGLR